jgi:hypothetical protein
MDELAKIIYLVSKRRRQIEKFKRARTVSGSQRQKEMRQERQMRSQGIILILINIERPRLRHWSEACLHLSSFLKC